MEKSGYSTQELRNLVKLRQRGTYIYILPNLFTATNLVFGFLSVISSMEGNFEYAAWAILLATVFDLLDGRVARLTNTMTRFGTELDSLCDLISFGMAPAILIYQSSLREMGGWGLVVAMVFLLCGALRLARFNVFSNVVPKSYFQGLPIPAASAAIVTLIFFMNSTGHSLEDNFFVPALVLFLSFLMVTTIRFFSFKKIYLGGPHSIPIILTAIIIVPSLILWFETLAFLLLHFYIALSLFLDLLRHVRRKDALQ